MKQRPLFGQPNTTIGVFSKEDGESTLAELTDDGVGVVRGTAEAESRGEKHFKKHQCLKNIRFLLDKKGVRLGDIERASGNTPGYLSRIEKEGSTTDPSTEFLVTAAKMLEVSMDALLFHSFEELSPNEELVLTFLEQLIKDTEADKIDWEMETFKDHQRYEDWPMDRNHPHCLYSFDYEYDSEGGRYPNGYSYDSRFYPAKNIVVEGACFHTVDMKHTGASMYLMNCIDEDGGERPFLEAYHCTDDGKVRKICCDKDINNQISAALNRLYQAAGESVLHIRLEQETKDWINNYLG